MSVRVVGDPRSRFWAWRRSHAAEADDGAAIWAAAWAEGARETLHLDAQLARDIGQIHALLERLEFHVQQYAERELNQEDGSAYWHTEAES